jgi:hypothetical protein
MNIIYIKLNVNIIKLYNLHVNLFIYYGRNS